MLCEMCSSRQASYKADVEGAKLNVCEVCARYGKILGRVSAPAPVKKKAAQATAQPKLTETVQVIRQDYARVIKSARERLGLTQENFAKRLTEKESLLHKVESGHMKPDLALARKLERALKISLVEQVELESMSEKKGTGKNDGLTIGDLIHIKK